FAKEAEIAAGLDHMHIVPVFEVGTTIDGIFIVSLYCPGMNLGQWLARNPNRLSYAQIVELMICLAEAIAYCHDRNILHRDLKPANVLLFPTEHGPLPFLPRLTDFGLAKVLESTLTETGSSVLLGTPLYMAPEQAWSRSDEIGPPTDVYALGAIFYELLTGRTPFQASSLASMLDQIRTELPVVPSKLNKDVPKALETICLKCLAKEPCDRYASARFLLDDLKTFANGGSIVARRLSLLRRLAQWCEQPARLRESSLAIIFANVVLLGTMVLVVLMERLELIPRSTPDGLLPLLSCSLSMGAIHVPLVYLATLVAKGKVWAGIVSLVSGVLLTLTFVCFLLGILSTSDFYWNDIPGFRVVYGGFCMLALVQVLASIVGLLGMRSGRFKRTNVPVKSAEDFIAMARKTVRPTIAFATIGILAWVALTNILPTSSPFRRMIPFFGNGIFGNPVRKPQSGTSFNSMLNRVYVTENPFDGSSPFTIEAWIKPELPKGTIVNLRGMISIQSDDGKAGVGPTVVVHVSNNEMIYFYDPNPLTSSEWHHVAVVYHNDTIRLFIDGSEAACEIYLDEGHEATTHLRTSPAIKLNASIGREGLVIGGNSPTASPKHRYPFHGQIREVRLSSGVRYDSSFTPPEELTVDETTIANYRFSKNESARIDDRSGNSPPAIKLSLFSP
ncbi:MAG: protein kinase, partial [Pirellula sp.]